jgi:hypothetical protein
VLIHPRSDGATMSSQYKVVVYVPVAAAQAIRDAIGTAGAGEQGNYAYCSFSVTGIGRFKPGTGARPAIGQIGKLEEVTEERIEAACERGLLRHVIAAIVAAHPYEEPAIDILPLENWKDFAD